MGGVSLWGGAGLFRRGAAKFRREDLVAHYAAVQLDSAALHLAHGLRPMEESSGSRPYVQAQRPATAAFFRTAHCLRGYYTTLSPTSGSFFCFYITHYLF